MTLRREMARAMTDDVLWITTRIGCSLMIAFVCGFLIGYVIGAIWA